MSFAVLSYGSAAVVYALLTLVLMMRRESRRHGQRVFFAVSGTAVWGLVIALLLVLPGRRGVDLVHVPDALRTLLWILCLIAPVPGRGSLRNSKGTIGVAAVLCTGLVVVLPLLESTEHYGFVPLLALSIIGCLAVEQIMRNSTVEQKRILSPFLWTIAAILAYDLFVYAHAALFDAMDLDLWSPRGILAAAAAPFFVLAAKRHPDWEETLFVSRELVFYSATLIAVGAYLVVVAAGGVWIEGIRGEWSAVIHLVYLLAAFGVLAVVLSSARLKAQLRVFISKHFYRNRYDYRDEWVRLTRTLSASEQLPLDQRSIKGLCAIIDSSGGQLWLDRESRSVYEPFAAWQAPFPNKELTERSALVKFLRQHQWVVDTRQYRENPEHYQHVFRDECDELPDDSIIFPLIHENEMLGIIRLNRADELGDLNYEDHDLLKTAGREVAAFLAHDLAKEQLAETRQFEAYSKLSAFVMHDLKNLLAQQALLVNNAKKFGDRPDFVTDMISTVDNGVQRMRRLLKQLEQGLPAAQDQRVELNKVILRAVSACSDDGKAVCSFMDHSTFWVRAHPDQLMSVITHVVQNAQEAMKNRTTPVTVTLTECADDRVMIEVKDSGEGMSEEFVRRRLFKPFETTKGASGMGIGAHQAREIVRALGGEFTVVSEVGRGTVVRIFLPRARPSPDLLEQSAR